MQPLSRSPPSLPISLALYFSYHNGPQFQSDGFLSLTLRKIGSHPSPSFQPPHPTPKQAARLIAYACETAIKESPCCDWEVLV